MTYPSSLDELTDGVPSDVDAPTTPMDSVTYPHDDHHRAMAVAVEAVEAELGTDPSGSEATVKARIAATETVANAAAAKASNLSDLASASSARTNLGLGGAAVLAVGTTAGTVAAGDDSRITGAVPKSTVTTAGDLIYGTGNAAVSRLGIGSALQVLRTNAGATAPEWATVSSGAVSVIARTVVGTPASSVDFQSIPSTYESLRIVYAARGTTSAELTTLLLRFNGDTASHYGHNIHGSNYTVSWDHESVDLNSGTSIKVALDIAAATAAAGSAGAGTIDIPGYARTVWFKDLVASTASVHGWVRVGNTAGVWSSTAAINQVTLFPGAGNFDTGTVFTLYGIAGS